MDMDKESSDDEDPEDDVASLLRKVGLPVKEYRDKIIGAAGGSSAEDVVALGIEGIINEAGVPRMKARLMSRLLSNFQSSENQSADSTGWLFGGRGGGKGGGRGRGRGGKSSARGRGRGN